MCQGQSGCACLNGRILRLVCPVQPERERLLLQAPLRQFIGNVAQPGERQARSHANAAAPIPHPASQQARAVAGSDADVAGHVHDGCAQDYLHSDRNGLPCYFTTSIVTFGLPPTFSASMPDSILPRLTSPLAYGWSR